ncbi:MAG: hypothetical protein K2M15_00005 [Oscillospiraceae bacterium]|nr:hypothetical protein [Oscillospiraceae bacterium]MDE7170499.1 hypothetical protein [Oscillospiraceae bacterium]
MTESEAIQAWHSVRRYLNKPLKPDGLCAAITLGHAFYVKMDPKYYFEVGAGKEKF